MYMINLAPLSATFDYGTAWPISLALLCLVAIVALDLIARTTSVPSRNTGRTLPGRIVPTAEQA